MLWHTMPIFRPLPLDSDDSSRNILGAGNKLWPNMHISHGGLELLHRYQAVMATEGIESVASQVMR